MDAAVEQLVIDFAHVALPKIDSADRAFTRGRASRGAKSARNGDAMMIPLPRLNGVDRVSLDRAWFFNK